MEPLTIVTTDNKRFCSGLAMDELDQKVSAVLCPGCILAMKEVEQKPILFSHGLCDVTFVCEICHMHTVRTMKRD